MNLIYSLQSDRFYAFQKGKAIKIKPKFHKINGNEYVRYLPQDNLTVEDVNAFLALNQYETCIEITDKCNLTCPVCISDSKVSEGKSLPLKKLKEVIQDLPESVVRLTITGGEPTLHNRIENILNISTEKFRGTILSTNGYHPEKLDTLLRGKSNLIVAVSIHGPRAVHDKFVGTKGSFQKAIESVRLSIDNQIYTHVYTTATSQNLKSLPILFELLSELPIAEHRINLVKQRGRINEACAGYDAVNNLVKKSKHQSKITIKKQGQPYIFIDCCGCWELRNAG